MAIRFGLVENQHRKANQLAYEGAPNIRFADLFAWLSFPIKIQTCLSYTLIDFRLRSLGFPATMAVAATLSLR